MKQKVFFILALLLMAATSAWAQTPTLLTTIEAANNPDFTSGSKTFDNIATVTFSADAEHDNYWGWYTSKEFTITVTPVEGNTITSCKFYTTDASAEDTQSPFEINMKFDDMAGLASFFVDGNEIIGDGVKKIEVYGYAGPQNVLYAEVEGTAMTLKHGLLPESGAYEYNGTPFWAEAFNVNVTTATVDKTCKDYAGANLANLFSNMSKLTAIDGLTNLNTANVTSMRGLFSMCGALTSLDLSGFNTENVTDMSNMFNNCSALTSLDLSGFNTANVTEMPAMFGSCSSLATINVGKSWNTDKVTNSTYMFYGDTKLPNFDSDKIDVTNAHTGEGGYLSLIKKYAVTLAEDTENAADWTIDPAKAKENETVTLKYNGLMKVESITAVKKEAVARTLAEATAADLGKIAGADGNIYDTKDAAEAAGTQAVAMIAYVGKDTGILGKEHGLAIALADEGMMDWRTALSTCFGKPAVPGAEWTFPSDSQWKAMFKAFGGNDADYYGLDTALATAGGDSSKLQRFYWSSTPDGDDYLYFGYAAVGDVNWSSDIEASEYFVRACFGF